MSFSVTGALNHLVALGMANVGAALAVAVLGLTGPCVRRRTTLAASLATLVFAIGSVTYVTRYSPFREPLVVLDRAVFLCWARTDPASGGVTVSVEHGYLTDEGDTSENSELLHVPPGGSPCRSIAGDTWTPSRRRATPA